ncbi:MAG: acetate--CoA ligase [Bryobacterales bacterium]|jgi:acetyl-CoA synthetase|nr:acetate--CoA ligase [Bryobacterales bacterium]
MEETALYPPHAGFVSQANVSGYAAYEQLFQRAAEDPEGFWGHLAEEELHWFEKWSHVFEWQPPFVKWFVGGKINASYNCLDRHIEAGHGERVAFHFVGELGDTRDITYRELLATVCQFTNAMKQAGIQPGGRAVIYMPMVPELPAALLACARLGVTHSVVFGGFSAEALRFRIDDLEAELVITADGGWRRGKEVRLKDAVDEAMQEGCASVKHVVVLQRTGSAVTMREGRDIYWHDFIAGASAECPAEELDAEHPLYVLYTSGTTGKPKGILHTTAGYLLQNTMAMKWVFDLKPNDIYWCAADVGWVTGHSYIVYGPLSAGATSVLYEGAPDYPKWDRWWEIVARYKVNILYTSPTAIRALLRQGDAYPQAHDLSSLRLLGSVGEPINPAAWEWYHRVIGGGRCPIVDTWWQTETGSIMIAPLPGAIDLKPGSATRPLPGVQADLVDLDGNPLEGPGEGYLVVRRPWPSMARTLWKDPQRYESAYWSRIPGIYFTGDAARRDEDGYFWVLGRVDDVMNVSGHRLSTMELESSLVRHPSVAEAAVIGKPDELTGQAVVAFVTLKQGEWDHSILTEELRQWVGKEIGSFAKPKEIRFAEGLPKTRSGKIMRRLLRELAVGNTVSGDTTTLEDFNVVNKLASKDED